MKLNIEVDLEDLFEKDFQYDDDGSWILKDGSEMSEFIKTTITNEIKKKILDYTHSYNGFIEKLVTQLISENKDKIIEAAADAIAFNAQYVKERETRKSIRDEIDAKVAKLSRQLYDEVNEKYKIDEKYPEVKD